MFKHNLCSPHAFAWAMMLFSSVVQAQEPFKSSKFLEGSRAGQESYIRASVGMAGLVAARNDKTHADCIDRWYFSDIGKGNQRIIETMKENPDYHPQAVILAMLQKACGSFTYANK